MTLTDFALPNARRLNNVHSQWTKIMCDSAGRQPMGGHSCWYAGNGIVTQLNSNLTFSLGGLKYLLKYLLSDARVHITPAVPRRLEPEREIKMAGVIGIVVVGLGRAGKARVRDLEMKVLGESVVLRGVISRWDWPCPKSWKDWYEKLSLTLHFCFFLFYASLRYCTSTSLPHTYHRFWPGTHVNE